MFAVYNMGTMDHALGDVFEKVNDGVYHVVRFTRNGPNSTIQVDDLSIQAKHPTGELGSIVCFEYKKEWGMREGELTNKWCGLDRKMNGLNKRWGLDRKSNGQTTE